MKKPPAAQSVSEEASLRSISWSQTAMSADECFWFSLGSHQWDEEAEGRFLNCEFRGENGEFIRRRDAQLSDAQWTELENMARTLDLPPYTPADEHLLDAPDSEITVTWEAGDEILKYRYSTEGADALYELLCRVAPQTQSAEQYEETEN